MQAEDIHVTAATSPIYCSGPSAGAGSRKGFSVKASALATALVGVILAMLVLLYWGWGLGSLGSGVALAEVPLHSQSLQSAVKPGSGVAPGHGFGSGPDPAGGNGGRSGGVLPGSPQNAPACGPNWIAVPCPDQGPLQYTLNGVASVSANDV